MNNHTKPAVRVADGAIKASVWRNESTRNVGEHFYSVQFSRTYKDKAGQFQDSDRFSGTELLRLARVAEKAYDQIVKLRQDDRVDGEDIDLVRDPDLPDSEDTPF